MLSMLLMKWFPVVANKQSMDNIMTVLEGIDDFSAYQMQVI